jgi:hypothetical protein
VLLVAAATPDHVMGRGGFAGARRAEEDNVVGLGGEVQGGQMSDGVSLE